MKGKGLHMIAFLLVIVGGLNWLLLAVFGTDIGTWIGGMESIQAKVVYVLVGLSAIYLLVGHKKNCKMCSMGNGMGQ
ncbi:MAG: DUF378 domain-containing protein [Patescibacteria group bacterium]